VLPPRHAHACASDVPHPARFVPGYTIGYFGRPFETKRLQELDSKDEGYLRFELGAGSVIPALELGVSSMAEGGVRQIVGPRTHALSLVSRPAGSLCSNSYGCGAQQVPTKGQYEKDYNMTGCARTRLSTSGPQ